MRFSSGTIGDVRVALSSPGGVHVRTLLENINLSGGVDNEPDAGVVVRDELFRHVRAGRAFHAGTTQAGVAAQLQAISLRNPAASGKTFLVFAAVASRGTAGVLQMADLADVVLPGAAGMNMLSGGAVGNGVVAANPNAGALGANVWHREVAAALTQDMLPSVIGFYELSAGRMLKIQNDVVNVRINASYIWAEL